MITKRTTYALYGNQIQADGKRLAFAHKGQVCPRVVTHADLIAFESQLKQQTGKEHHITVWYPTKTEYVWFMGLKKWFKEKFKTKKA